MGRGGGGGGGGGGGRGSESANRTEHACVWNGSIQSEPVAIVNEVS